MAQGDNPNEKKRAQRARGVTLGEAFAEFEESRKSLRPSTVRHYRAAMRLAFPDWRPKPLMDISKDMVAARHAKIGAERGPAFANHAMRVLRAVLNFSRARFEGPHDPFSPLVLVLPEVGARAVRREASGAR
jgi:hypothetical protein